MVTAQDETYSPAQSGTGWARPPGRPGEEGAAVGQTDKVQGVRLRDVPGWYVWMKV